MISQIKEALELELQKENFASRIKPQGLFEPIDYTLELGGKRIRPILCLIGSYLFSDDWEKSIPQAIALEIFHNFTLLHDDLMDKSSIRRGKQTVYKKWNENTAVLSGDAMSILAYDYICRTENITYLPRILKVFTNTALDVCRGQQYDMEFETRSDVSVPEYLEMIKLKTAVLLGASLQIGALTMGANTDTSNQLYHIGIDFGLAFQIQDDILDVYADQETFGKPIGGDICNSKKTFLLLYTQSKLSVEDNNKLSQLLKLPASENKKRIEEVKRLYEKVNAREAMELEVKKYINKTFDAIEKLPIADVRKSVLIELFNGLINRQK